MTRVLMLVEGPTEKQFVTDVLCPHLNAYDVYVKPVIVTTRVNPQGTDNKGGYVPIDRLIKQITALLADTDAVTTTFFDLYKMTGRAEGETAAEFENILDDEVNRPNRFMPYIQQYEFEALIFSAPDVCAAELLEPIKSQMVQAIVDECGNPEEINDGEATAPSKRLISLFPGYGKVLDGPNILMKTGLEKISEACPRFAGWLNFLQQLGGQDVGPVVQRYRDSRCQGLHARSGI